MHTYETHLYWSGTTAAGIRSYSRDHTGLAPPATTEVELSADPAFGGNPERLNPEQLLVLAASSCQMLSFLGAAARAGLEVLSYADQATSRLDLTGSPAALGTIHLAVTVQVPPGTEEARVLELVEQAHRECYIANSLASGVDVRTTVCTR